MGPRQSTQPHRGCAVDALTFASNDACTVVYAGKAGLGHAAADQQKSASASMANASFLPDGPF